MRDAYPKRPAFFAHKFCRLLFKQCAANEIGAEACWLLTVIAHTEDARHYTGAVSFFNLQLAPLVGLGSVDALDRVRRKAIAAGWLHYEPGAKGVAGRYWVTVPERCADLGDGPTDETAGELDGGFVADTSAKSRTNPGSKCGSNREESAEHSSLSLTPSPVAVDSTAATTPVKAPKAKKPRPRNPLFDAVAEVTGSDPAVDGGRIGKFVALLSTANPPYSPGEIRDLAARWRELLSWAKAPEFPRLTLGILEKHISPMRAAARDRPAIEPARIRRAADNVIDRSDYAPVGEL